MTFLSMISGQVIPVMIRVIANAIEKILFFILPFFILFLLVKGQAARASL